MCLQALSWWVKCLMLRGKIIDLNNFKTGILDDAIEQSRIDVEDTRDVKWDLSNLKELSYENWYQWEDIIYNYFTSRGGSRDVPLSYVIRKNTLSLEDSKNRDLQIIYQASLVGDILNRDSRKVIAVLK